MALQRLRCLVRAQTRYAAFLRCLLSKDAIADLKTSRSTFWHKTVWAWRIWPIAPGSGEIHNVVFLDGIWLRRKAAVLVAVAGGHIVGWHLARSECGSAWAALMLHIPAPQDGDLWHLAALRSGKGGVARHERAAMHLPCGQPGQTLKPKLEARVEPLGIANSLKDAGFATAWLLEYSAWCTKWATFLKEFTGKDGKRVYTHEHLRKARRILNKLVKDGTLFTFVEMQQEYGGEWPSTNNAVESVNARLQDVFRHHRRLFAPAPRQGDLLVVLHAHGKPASAGGYHPRHAN